MSDKYERPIVYARFSRGALTAKEAAENVGVSERTARRWTSQTREQYLRQQAQRREKIRRYHDDQGHSWPETAKHFRISEDCVRRLAYKARKERAREAEEKAKGPTLFDVEEWND